MSREVDLRVAWALGQTLPPEDEATSWEPSEDGDGTWVGEEQLRYEDGSWQRAIRIREWPAHYSTDIANAWTLVSGEFYLDHLDCTTSGKWYALFGGDQNGWAMADSAAEAICRAFLAAKGPILCER